MSIYVIQLLTGYIAGQGYIGTPIGVIDTNSPDIEQLNTRLLELLQISYATAHDTTPRRIVQVQDAVYQRVFRVDFNQRWDGVTPQSETVAFDITAFRLGKFVDHL